MDVRLDTIETWKDGRCVGDAPMHTSRCTNQTNKDGYCDCLADAANHCAQAHDQGWWQFTACMFERNGKGSAPGTGISDDSTFQQTVKTCSQKLSNYSFQDLKTCYTSAEGFAYSYQSAQASDKAKVEHPVWMYVGGKLISGDDFSSADEWAAKVKSTICSSYTGTKPASCGSQVIV